MYGERALKQSPQSSRVPLLFAQTNEPTIMMERALAAEKAEPEL